MQLRKIPLLALLVGAITLGACGDGSVRSPGLVGSGALLKAELECRTPGEDSFSACEDTRNIIAGQTIDYRVVGDFEDGSRRIATSRFRFDSSDDSLAQVLDSTNNNVRTVRALAETPAGAPITISALDSNAEVEALTSELTIEGGVPETIDITLNGNDLRAVSGVPTQLFARITFEGGEPEPITVPNDQDARAPGNIQWTIEVDPEGTSDIFQDGVLIGRNPSIEEELELTVRVSLTPRENGAQFEGPITAERTVTIEPAEYVRDSFRIRFLRDESTVPLDATRRLEALATFQGVPNDEGETVSREFEVTRNIDPGFEVEDPAIGEIVFGADQAEDADIPNSFKAAMIGSTSISAGFRGDSATTNVQVVEAGIGQLRLLPVSGENAELLGLTADGRLLCEADPMTCPDDSLAPDDDGIGALELNRTLPGVGIAYQVFGVLEGNEDTLTEELDAGEIFLLGDIVECPEDDLSVDVSASDNGAVEVTEIRTANGEVAYEVVGLAEGSAELRARIGRGPDAENGINCAGRNVTDASQTVDVGFPEGDAEVASLTTKAGAPIRSITLETNDVPGCVGFINTESLLTDLGGDIRDRVMVRTTAAYEDAEGKSLRIPVNQQGRINFSAQPGTRDDEGRMCDDPAADEEDSPVIVSNDRNVLRGILQSRSETSVGNACVRSNFDLEGVSIDGALQTSQSLSATVAAVPIADDLTRDGCAALLELFGLLPDAD